MKFSLAVLQSFTFSFLLDFTFVFYLAAMQSKRELDIIFGPERLQ